MKVFSVCGAEKFHTDVPLHGRSFSHSLYFGPQTLSRCLYSGSSYHLVLGNFVNTFFSHPFSHFSFFSETPRSCMFDPSVATLIYLSFLLGSLSL